MATAVRTPWRTTAFYPGVPPGLDTKIKTNDDHRFVKVVSVPITSNNWESTDVPNLN